MGLLRVPLDLIDRIAEARRPELRRRQETIDRENNLMDIDKNRFNWIISNVYLTPGNLGDLEKHPDFVKINSGYIFAYFAHNPGRGITRNKKVRVELAAEDNDPAFFMEAERQLKYELHLRDANAGVYYRLYKRGRLAIAEATPAILICE